MTIQESIKILETALQQAAMCDQERKHDVAERLLNQALSDADGDADMSTWNDEIAIQFANLVQKCARECDRQAYRHALLCSYLSR